MGFSVFSATIACPHCSGLIEIRLLRIHADVDCYAPPESCACKLCGRTFAMKAHQPLVVVLPAEKQVSVAGQLQEELCQLEDHGCSDCVPREISRIFRAAQKAEVDPFSLSQWEKWQSYCYAH